MSKDSLFFGSCKPAFALDIQQRFYCGDVILVLCFLSVGVGKIIGERVILRLWCLFGNNGCKRFCCFFFSSFGGFSSFNNKAVVF